MKKISRMLVFSALAIYITALWNKGFTIHNDIGTYLKAIILISILYYLIYPLTKLILLPLNILTLGLVGMVVYFLLFYFVINHWPIITIKDWLFPGLTYAGLTINKTKIGYLFNVILSALSISFIINFFEAII